MLLKITEFYAEVFSVDQHNLRISQRRHIQKLRQTT
jgi:hypothetical protein